MGVINVKGLGAVEIEGDLPTDQEMAEIEELLGTPSPQAATPPTPDLPPLPFGMTWEGVAEELPQPYRRGVREEIGVPIEEPQQQPSMMPGRVGFDVARQYPTTVITEEDVRQAQRGDYRRATAMPSSQGGMYAAATPTQEPGLVAPTMQEAAATMAAAPAMAAGAIKQAAQSAVEAPAVVAREAGLPPQWPFEHVWERRDEEAELAAQEEARLQEDLGKEWSEAISEDAEAIASMGEVLGHAVNKAMEEAKEKGEDPIKAVADLGFEGGEKMVKAFDRDLLLLAANPTEYPRAYPLTTFFLALPAMPAAAAGAKSGTISLLNIAKQSPAISRMMEKSGDLLVKAHKEFSLRRTARKHGMTAEELRRAQQAVEEAPTRPGPEAPPPIPTEPPPAAPRVQPKDDLTSLRYDIVDEDLAKRGMDPMDTGPVIPDEAHYAGLTSGGSLTDDALNMWEGIKARVLNDNVHTVTPREKAVVDVIHRDAATKAARAMDESDAIVSGLRPEYPVGSEAAKTRLIELNHAFSVAESTWQETISVNAKTVSNAARVLRLQQYFMTSTFDLLHMKKVAQMKKGSKLTPKEVDQLQALSKKARDAQAKLDEITEELNGLRKKAEGLTGEEAALLDMKMQRLREQMFGHAKDFMKASEGWAALKHKLSKGTTWGAISDLGTIIVHGPKMMRAIWDASGATVQAGLSGLGHPLDWLKSLRVYVPGAGQAWTERGAFTTALGLVDDPAWDVAIKSGLPLYDMGGASGAITGLTTGDDMFAQGVLTQIVNNNPLMGAWIKPSTRVHAAFLNSYRLSLFKTLLGLDLPPVGQMNPMLKLTNPFRRNYYSKVIDIRKKMEGATGKRLEALQSELILATQEADQFANAMAKYAGAASGHGAWFGGKQGMLGAFFWSQRMFTAAFEHPSRALGGTYKGLRLVGKDLDWADDAAHSVAKRAQIAASADAARSAVGMGALLWGLEQTGWEVSMNPFSPDFGRARKGDSVVDFGGFQMVLMRAVTGWMRGDKAWIQMGRFLRKKANPGLSAVMDLFEGEDYMGAPVDVATTLGNLAIPLSAENFLKAMHSGELKDSPYYTGFKMLGGKTWKQGDERDPLSEIFPYKHIPYAGEIDVQLELPEWVTDPKRLD